MKLSVSSPYRENSVLSIASEASRRGTLDRFYTTLYPAGWSRRVSCLPLIGQRLSRELSRRAFAGIAPSEVAGLAGWAELFRIACFRLATGFVDFPSQVMYWGKVRFDRAAAHEVQRRPVDAVLGMWGSSSLTFASAGRSTVKVLNFVNSRPRCHNDYLRRFAGLGQGNGEVLSPAVEAAVEEEMRLADLILVPSQFIARQMPEYASKVLVEPYGVDLEAFSPGSAHEPFLTDVLFVGQVCYRKGFTTLIEAARRMPNISFQAIGPIVATALLKSLPSNLRYAGLAMHGDLPSRMRSAKVFVLPSFEDSYGLVTLEAMASGTPVIVSDHAGTAEVVRHGEDGFVFPAGDVEAFCAAIACVTGDSVLRARMSTAAREAVVRSHSWRQYSSRVLDMIERYTLSAVPALPRPGA